MRIIFWTCGIGITERRVVDVSLPAFYLCDELLVGRISAQHCLRKQGGNDKDQATSIPDRFEGDHFDTSTHAAPRTDPFCHLLIRDRFWQVMNVPYWRLAPRLSPLLEVVRVSGAGK